ncbi:hypothetical protein PVK06_026561 [Gossypium arboreum]|uniref:RNase H type-1 domain-containing protein n=1 Tax=Gossypium arboreum TaxID=29729 RepID=A0ABR0NYJ6_GOSAR|nr:hypothetical protein PVK06_026561 [Gossypium arboreum]
MAISISWSRLEEGYVKFNIDSAVLSFRACASVRGTIRDTNGVWQCGFSMTIGDGTIFQVEVKAVLEGLRLA